MRALSPFSRVPPIPAADPALGPVPALIAAALAAAGMALFQCRDLAGFLY